MKASLQWMNEYVPVDMNRPAQELADELTQAGIPVEDVIAMDNGIKKIYTGKIVEITKHPDADKLQVCQVECLTEEGEPWKYAHYMVSSFNNRNFFPEQVDDSTENGMDGYAGIIGAPIDKFQIWIE